MAPTIEVEYLMKSYYSLAHTTEVVILMPTKVELFFTFNCQIIIVTHET